MTFKDLDLIDPILRALNDEDYTQATPIQEQSIPILLQGKDLLGCAQTGTGKTAAFTIPILQLMHQSSENSSNRKIKALIITPTRELALQIHESVKTYGKNLPLKSTVVFGGVNQNKQTARLKQSVDILIATPGRLLDLMNQGFISLKHIKYFVLDEADQMLDMGFIHDIKKVLNKLPQNRQSLFFSATMAPAIIKLSDQILGNPQKVTIKPQQTTAERVEQSIFPVAKSDKVKLLIHLLNEKQADSTLVFSRTKHGANKIVKKLAQANIKAEAIHGNKSQAARVKALDAFKDRTIKVLIATDIAARGIDIDDLELVINYDLPNVAESYVHRIGRTGRANANGEAISFYDTEEAEYLRNIQHLIKQELRIEPNHPYYVDIKVPAAKSASSSRKKKKKNRPHTKSKSDQISKTESQSETQPKFKWRRR